MYKIVIPYHDMDGNEINNEEFRFHLSKAKILELEISAPGGSLYVMMNNLIKKRDGKNIMETYKKLILMSYGEISDDRKGFVQNKELSEAFEQTEAYSELFTSLVTDPDKAEEFFESILPADIAAKYKEEAAKGELPELTVVK